MRVIGAGLPRTGTRSLTVALERLLGAPCYHMHELFARREHATTWQAVLAGAPLDRLTFLAGYAAGVDAPVSLLWRELAAACPDAVVLLSRRADAVSWYASLERTVLAQVRQVLAAGGPPWLPGLTAGERAAYTAVFDAVAATLGPLDDPAAVRAAYDRRLAEVRAAVPAARLVEWQPGDGWEPLCTALGVPVPDDEFPHENSAAEFADRAATRLRAAGVQEG